LLKPGIFPIAEYGHVLIPEDVPSLRSGASLYGQLWSLATIIYLVSPKFRNPILSGEEQGLRGEFRWPIYRMVHGMDKITNSITVIYRGVRPYNLVR
jgi:hypothetical protein